MNYHGEFHLKKLLKRIREVWHNDILQAINKKTEIKPQMSSPKEIEESYESIIKEKHLGNSDEMAVALKYIKEFNEEKRADMILKAPDTLRHIYERITDIILCDREAKSQMEKVYEGDRYFFRRIKDPGGELTLEQKKQVNEFWKRYEFCYKNNPETQRIFSIASGRFDPSYVPWGLFRYYCIKYWNNAIIDYVRDKNYTKLAFPNIKQPNVIIRRISNRYYNAEWAIISKKEACNICFDKLNLSEFQKIIVKPWEGGGGAGISFLRKGDSKEHIMAILESYNVNFICEEIVIAHYSYAEPHPLSLNTLRVITFSYKMDIYLVGVLFRTGVGKTEVDNLGSGGLMMLLKDGGFIGYAYDKYGNKFYSHPDGYSFSGKKLYNVDKAVAAAKKLHSTIPQLRYISWDIAIDQEGEPVLIELNGGGNQVPLQMSGGHIFINKEITKDLLDNWLLKPFFYNRANWNWNFREYYDHIEITKYAGLDTSVKIPETMNGKPVTVIKNWAFSNGKIKEILLPKAIRKIEDQAFSKAGDNCKIIEV